MIEDSLLVLKFKRGNREAMCAIYHKYKDRMLTLANGLLVDRTAAEDVVHDVFVAFVKSIDNVRATGNLQGYLTVAVANRSRDYIRRRSRHPETSCSVEIVAAPADRPDQQAISSEQSRHLRAAIYQLPYDQREVVILHAFGQMKFNRIARLQEVSINTVQGRYRYGLKKLRSLLNGRVI